MKKVFLLLMAAGGFFSASAQEQSTENTSTQADSMGVDSTVARPKKKYKADSLLSRWVLDINGYGGLLTQDITKANTNSNYFNAIDPNTGKLKFNNGMSFGGDVQFGFFWGHKGHFGIGTGFMYLQQQGEMVLDEFKVQYESVDSKGSPFRQVTRANQPITEKLTITNMNIPLVLKYKNRFSRRLGFTADAGILYNLQMMNSYSTDASFDYEAIYKFSGGSAVYDNSPTPSVNSWLITKDQLSKHNSGGSVADTMNLMRSQGYNVGLAQTPEKKSGTTEYTMGTVGFIVKPALSYYFSDRVALNLGVYYMYQPVNNTVKSDYMLTNKVGEYNSITNSVASSVFQSYGGNLGLRIYLGTYKPRYQNVEAHNLYIDSTNPSVCGLSDGLILLHGLSAGEPVSVMYTKNGQQQPVMADTVSPLGTFKIPGLSAGAYTNVMAVVDEDTFRYANVNLVNPVLGYFSVSTTQPSANNACDGAIKLHGLQPGLRGTVNYSKDGAAQSPFTGVLGSDGTVEIKGLCPGTYSNIVANFNSCMVKGNNVTLNNPPPPPPPPAPEEKSGRPDVSTPILFDVNKTIINEVSFPVLESAIYELNEDPNTYIVIDGYTDITGSKAYNKVLSTRRANAVKAYLTQKGISGKRLQAVGHGINDPIADNSTPEGRTKNRRVIMSLKHKR